MLAPNAAFLQHDLPWRMCCALLRLGGWHATATGSVRKKRMKKGVRPQLILILFASILLAFGFLKRIENPSLLRSADTFSQCSFVRNTE